MVESSKGPAVLDVILGSAEVVRERLEGHKGAVNSIDILDKSIPQNTSTEGEKVGYLKDGEPFFYADEN